MTTVPSEVLVFGAGVSGLTTAVCLAEIGFAVCIRTLDLPHATTSCAAGAIWSPYLVSHPNVEVWGAQTLEALAKLADDPATGVRMVTGTEASRTPVEPPDWAVRVEDFRWCTPGELPDGFVGGWRYTVPVVDMPAYLSYLAGRPTDAGRTTGACRAGRPTVRVEHVPGRDRHVIHNYGHGGAGVSLSWGCAREVAGIVSELSR